MSLTPMAFTPATGLVDATAFPDPATEAAARLQVQTPSNQIRDFYNNTAKVEIDSLVSTHAANPTEYTATMQNGFTASITYKKDQHNRVTIVMNVHNIPTITAGTVICTLPAGYRPALLVIPCLVISTPPNKNIMPFLIAASGNITIASGSELNVTSEAYLAGEVSYYAAN